jgi:hypothetical protein
MRQSAWATGRSATHSTYRFLLRRLLYPTTQNIVQEASSMDKRTKEQIEMDEDLEAKKPVEAEVHTRNTGRKPVEPEVHTRNTGRKSVEPEVHTRNTGNRVVVSITPTQE